MIVQDARTQYKYPYLCDGHSKKPAYLFDFFLLFTRGQDDKKQHRPESRNVPTILN